MKNRTPMITTTTATAYQITDPSEIGTTDKHGCGSEVRVI
jgi:hypothetical protein